jgi:GMP synthase (glutamine-hydrolysing)
VRAVGAELGLPEAIVWRHPFPGPGLGDPDRRRGDTGAAGGAARRRRDRPGGAHRAGLDRDIWQFPVVLLADVRSVGVQGDGAPTATRSCCGRSSSEDAMTADWARLPYDVLARISTRITNEVREVNRVVLDVTSKPPGTIEWE